MQWANLSTVRESVKILLTRGTVTRKCQDSPDMFITRQWHNFEGAKVKGGILECTFEKGKPVGQGKCTFYGSEYHSPVICSIIYILKRHKDFCRDEMYVVSFEGEIKWDRRYSDLHRLTWADQDDYRSCCPECTSGHYVLTLGNGERWEGKLTRFSECSGPWTRTNKNGTIEEVIEFSEKEN